MTREIVTRVVISETIAELAQVAAGAAARLLNEAIQRRGEAFLIAATGNSQLAMLEEFVKQDVPWGRVTMFHLDEYAGLSADHPASFRRYLKERLTSRVPLREAHFIEGDAGDARQECARIGALIRRHVIDLALVGVGENGHLAFNDPRRILNPTSPSPSSIWMRPAASASGRGLVWFA